MRPFILSLNEYICIKLEFMDIHEDKRIVMTLDAGGTNFVFNAVRSGEEIFEPHRIKAKGETLGEVLNKIRKGFSDIMGAACFPGRCGP